MKKLLFILLLSGLFWETASAQIGATNQLENEQNLDQLMSLNPLSPGARGFDNRYEGVKGSPYLFDDWQEGQALIRGNREPTEQLLLNLDQSENLLIVNVSGSNFGQVSANKIEAVYLSDERVFRSFPLSLTEGRRDSTRRFYEVLYEGEFLLLKDHEKIFQKADYKGAYSADRRYDEFLSEQHYLLRAPGAKVFEKFTNLKRKNLEKALPQYEDRIRKLAKEKKWSLKEEKEAIALLRLLEQSGK